MRTPAACRGFKVIRFWNRDVLTNREGEGVLTAIIDALEDGANQDAEAERESQS